MIGSNLGQFHNDFPLENGYAYKSIFVGKKCYCDLLTNPDDEKSIHSRMKGVDNENIRTVANKRYEGETEYDRIFNLYLNLFFSKPIEFDLSQTKVRMEMTKQQRMRNKSDMLRVVHFKGPKNFYKT